MDCCADILPILHCRLLQHFFYAGILGIAYIKPYIFAGSIYTSRAFHLFLRGQDDHTGNICRLINPSYRRNQFFSVRRYYFVRPYLYRKLLLAALLLAAALFYRLRTGIASLTVLAIASDFYSHC